MLLGEQIEGRREVGRIDDPLLFGLLLLLEQRRYGDRSRN